MKYQVGYSPAAKSDLKAIYAYIAFRLKEKTTAANQVNRIRERIRALDTSPERYAAVDWEPWASMGMRFFPVGNYVVYYAVDHAEATVTVNRIFYGGRNVERIIREEQN